jgi:hypothetical protein
MDGTNKDVLLLIVADEIADRKCKPRELYDSAQLG